ncbi:hypothetical protein ACFCYC_15590 [Streptomyces sp. NPDC056402]|uniref:hypothetical protein n=1 Tax=Streptomyces sp. NPDC056402 TaxID=3345810 RepID=UPI0035DB6AAD
MKVADPRGRTVAEDLVESGEACARRRAQPGSGDAVEDVVWWRCTAGPEREGHIATRTALPKWKGGDVAACRKCVGYKVSYSYPDCGRTVMVTPEAAAKKRGRCWKWRQGNEKRLKKVCPRPRKPPSGAQARC